MKSIIGLLVLATALPAQTPRYDLLLKGGHVIDPKNGIDRVADVAIADGRIARVAGDISMAEAKEVIDAAGLYVTPGLIDIHVHVYKRTNTAAEVPKMLERIDPDEISFRTGVTTEVDAGSSGWREFPDFRDRIIRHARTRVLAFLNIVGSGMGTGKEDDPEEMDPEAAARTAKENPGQIVGFKSAHYQGPGWYSIDNAVKAGNLTNLPVMVDFGLITPQRNIRILFADKLRPGDIYTHCFSGHREELLADGTLNPAMQAGRKRGIFFDIGHGEASFYWYVAVPAYKAGFPPDSISTDLTIPSMNAGAKDMPYVMSKMMALGSSLKDVIRMSTWTPAREIRRPHLGNLDVGAEADVAVLRLEHGHFGLIDSGGGRLPATTRITCELTLRRGQVVWDLDGLAAEDWQKVTYRKGPFYESKPAPSGAGVAHPSAR